MFVALQFLSIPRILVDKGYRQALLEHATDSENRAFFIDEFGKWPDRQRADALSPVQNKIGEFLAAPFVRNIISQWRPSVDLPTVIAARKILILRLPMGDLGEEQTNLLGSFVVSGIQQAVMRQTAHRIPFYLHIDEFPNFTTDSFASILSEARKYALSLTIAHQFTSQLSDPIRDAVFGNVGNIVAFKVGADDADHLAKEYSINQPQAFRDLRRGEVLARVMRDGEVFEPFIGRTSPHTTFLGTRERVLAKSRRAYGTPRAKVEQRLAEWGSNIGS